jgi:hypothetical protein
MYSSSLTVTSSPSTVMFSIRVCASQHLAFAHEGLAHEQLHSPIVRHYCSIR